MMEELFLEYIYKEKPEGRILLKRLLLNACVVLLFFVLLSLILNFISPLLHIPFILVDLALCSMTLYMLWKFLCKEYEVTLSGGELTVTAIYGRSVRRLLFSRSIASVYEFGLYDDEAYKRLCATPHQKNYVCVSSLSSGSIYYAVFGEGKERAVAYIEADERIVAYFKRYNPLSLRKGNIK